jgi:hypothetical protein
MNKKTQKEKYKNKKRVGKKTIKHKNKTYKKKLSKRNKISRKNMKGGMQGYQAPYPPETTMYKLSVAAAEVERQQNLDCSSKYPKMDTMDVSGRGMPRYVFAVYDDPVLLANYIKCKQISGNISCLIITNHGVLDGSQVRYPFDTISYASSGTITLSTGQEGSTPYETGIERVNHLHDALTNSEPLLSEEGCLTKSVGIPFRNKMIATTLKEFQIIDQAKYNRMVCEGGLCDIKYLAFDERSVFNSPVVEEWMINKRKGKYLFNRELNIKVKPKDTLCNDTLLSYEGDKREMMSVLFKFNEEILLLSLRNLFSDMKSFIIDGVTIYQIKMSRILDYLTPLINPKTNLVFLHTACRYIDAGAEALVRTLSSKDDNTIKCYLENYDDEQKKTDIKGKLDSLGIPAMEYFYEYIQTIDKLDEWINLEDDYDKQYVFIMGIE